jgi:hypothetical protein
MTRRTSRAPRGACPAVAGISAASEHDDPAFLRPLSRIKPSAKGVKGAVKGGQGAPGESKCCPEELAAWVGHARREEKFCRPV